MLLILKVQSNIITVRAHCTCSHQINALIRQTHRKKSEPRLRGTNFSSLSALSKRNLIRSNSRRRPLSACCMRNLHERKVDSDGGVCPATKQERERWAVAPLGFSP
jgi:hypothetical protein